MTEFGKTPLYTLQELKDANVDIVLYPLSAFRAMYKAAEIVYKAIIKEGDQKSILNKLQTRDELYDLLNYKQYEQYFDKLYGKKS